MAMIEKDREKKVINRRLLTIDDEIRSGSYPNSEKLAEKLEVSPRTILRDIEHLKLFYEAPIEYDFTRKGFYYTEPNFFIKSVMLTENEYKAITIYDDFLKNAYKDASDVNLRKAVGKILAAMPENKTKNVSFSPSGDKDCFFEPVVSINPQIWDDLSTAVSRSKIIEIEYRNIDKKSIASYTLKPLELEVVDLGDCYYLYAMDIQNKDKMEMFSINRIEKVNITNKKFKLPDDFETPFHVMQENRTDTSIKNTEVYKFEFIFPKEIASEAKEKIYHHNQKLELRKDGTVHVTFKSSLLSDVFRWVLGQGSKVKVINPPELVKMIKRELVVIGKYYL